MPIRRTGDKREHIEDWDSWIEKELHEARERGEFDNLSTEGKPLNLTSTDVDPQWDFAFSRMKNANALPAWMELDRDCHTLRSELDAFLERSARYLAGQVASLEVTPKDPEPPATPVPRWQIWKRIGDWIQLPPGEIGAPRLDRLDIMHMRATMREQYLERAALLDKKIVEFNHALSPNLMHLERMRMLLDRATRLFEAGCPPVP